jgi:hypothetical protein
MQVSSTTARDVETFIAVTLGSGTLNPSKCTGIRARGSTEVSCLNSRDPKTAPSALFLYERKRWNGFLLFSSANTGALACRPKSTPNCKSCRAQAWPFPSISRPTSQSFSAVETCWRREVNSNSRYPFAYSGCFRKGNCTLRTRKH